MSLSFWMSSNLQSSFLQPVKGQIFDDWNPGRLSNLHRDLGVQFSWTIPYFPYTDSLKLWIRIDFWLLRIHPKTFPQTTKKNSKILKQNEKKVDQGHRFHSPAWKREDPD